MVRFHSGATTPVVASCGVWQNTQTWVSVAALTVRAGTLPDGVVVPSATAEKLCLVPRTSDILSVAVIWARASVPASANSRTTHHANARLCHIMHLSKE